MTQYTVSSWGGVSRETLFSFSLKSEFTCKLFDKQSGCRPRRSCDVTVILFHFQIASVLPLNNTLVIYAKQRTGSTFTSSFFASDPQVTYLFEPLNQLKGDNVPWSALLDEFTSCNFSRIFHHASSYKVRWKWLSIMFCRFSAIYHMTADCGRKIQPDVWVKDCRKNPYVVAKVIKLPYVSYLSDALERGQRVIVLLRDPRGVSQSRVGIGRYRRHMSQSDEMDDVADYCNNMVQDIVWIKNHRKSNQCAAKRLILLRYEDLAKDPATTIRQMYAFYGRPAPEEVKTWANNLSNGKALGMKAEPKKFNVHREDPLETAWRWRWGMTWEVAQTVQRVCGEYMTMAGYELVDGEDQLKNRSFSLMRDANWVDMTIT